MNTQTTDNANAPEAQDDYFGLCPKCRRSAPYSNIGRNHWSHCDDCRTKWCTGSNLFSSWRDETEEQWRATFERLKDHEEVKPVYLDEACPGCGKGEGWVSVGSAVWCYCRKHMTAWRAIGEGVFSTERDDGPEEWRHAAEVLTGCRIVRGEDEGQVIAKDVMDEFVQQQVQWALDRALDIAKCHLEGAIRSYGELLDEPTRQRILAARELLFPGCGPVKQHEPRPRSQTTSCRNAPPPDSDEEPDDAIPF